MPFLPIITEKNLCNQNQVIKLWERSKNGTMLSLGDGGAFFICSTADILLSLQSEFKMKTMKTRQLKQIAMSLIIHTTAKHRMSRLA
jgi:hypothetical protein